MLYKFVNNANNHAMTAFIYIELLNISLYYRKNVANFNFNTVGNSNNNNNNNNNNTL